MTSDWQKTPYHPFNSMKVLLWRQHLEACAKDHYLTPITVDVDPSSKCNFKCIWCNARDIICKDESMKNLPEEHLIKLADFFKSWGADTPEGHPKGCCCAGGGEPLMNPGTMAFLERMDHNKLEVGLITNGSLLNTETTDIVARLCRWVGISVDAATPETFGSVKFGLNHDYEYLFSKVCDNIQKLCKRVAELGSNNRIAFKFLLHPLNYKEIFSAVKLAKSLGVHDFHLRPVGWENITAVKDKDPIMYTPDMIESINRQMESAMTLETANFHVYGIRHKFNPDFSVKRSFSRCWAIPILPTFGADGKVYMCFDMRGRPDTVMCNHYPDPTELARFWNSEKHKNLVKNFDISTCPRCTFTAYNEIVENVIIKDDMCVNFP